MSSFQIFVTVAATTALTWFTYTFDLLPYLDALSTIVALEYNNFAIRKRQGTASQRPERNSSYVACCIGYQESEATFERCLRSYKSSAPGCAAYLCMLDGTVDENRSMFEVFEREWDSQPEHHISYEQPLGEMCEEIAQRILAAKDDKQDYPRESAVEEAFDEVYQYARQRVEARLPLLRKSSTGILPLLVSQPHVGLKEVRFAAWVTSIALSDCLQVDYLWSSDSDSRVRPGCIDDCVATLVGDDSAGAASATLAVQDCQSSLFTRLYSGYYQAEHLLQRAPTACLGSVSCIHGPSGCYRVQALRPLVFEWYAQRVWGRKVWINEDSHITSLLLREGWSTLYVPLAIVENEAVESYMAWFKQTMRWERAGHWERFISPEPTFDPAQGVVRLFITLRDLLLRPYLFAYIVVLATTGWRFPNSHPSLGSALILSQFMQKGWIFLRLPRARRNLMGYWIAATIYVFSGPFTYVWAAGTLLEDTWESTTKKLSVPVLGFFCFAVWTAAVGVALVRLTWAL